MGVAAPGLRENFLEVRSLSDEPPVADLLDESRHFWPALHGQRKRGSIMND